MARAFWLCNHVGMATRSQQDLEAEIERLVRGHLTAQRMAAAAALERAFGAAVQQVPRRAERRSTGGVRRTAGEMADNSERLYDVIRANPGETMIFLAAQLGQLRSALVRPMMHLKASGRVRSAGQRHLTRYFPMGTSRAG